MHRPHYRGFTALLLVIFLTVGGCSNTFVYNQLDWLIPWYLNDYVDLNRQQNKTLKQRLRPLLQWHRSEELVQYVALLDGIDADLDGTLSGDQVAGWAEAAEAAYDRLEERMLPVAFEIGGVLSDSQMQGFLDNLQDGQRELEEEYLQRDDQEYREDAVESLSDTLSDLMGKLSVEQQQAIEQAVVRLRRFDSAWLEERARWLESLAGILEREPGWEAELQQVLDARERGRTEAYREAYRHNAVIVNQAIADVLNLRSPSQDKRLRGEIDGYRRDFTKLIAQ